MAIEVIGAGFGRTGTMSLKLALEKLGFDRCYHMAEAVGHPEHFPIWSAAQRGERIDWDALLEGYRATVDWPSCNLWQEQLEHWPEAVVILSTRDPESWYQSVMNTIYPASMRGYDSGDPFSVWLYDNIWGPLFDGRLDDRKHTIGVYERHVEHVIRSAPADGLLVFEAAQGWEPLCRFLDRPVPEEPFPRVNTTEEFARAHPARTS